MYCTILHEESLLRLSLLQTTRSYNRERRDHGAAALLHQGIGTDDIKTTMRRLLKKADEAMKTKGPKAALGRMCSFIPPLYPVYACLYMARVHTIHAWTLLTALLFCWPLFAAVVRDGAMMCGAKTTWYRGADLRTLKKTGVMPVILVFITCSIL